MTDIQFKMLNKDSVFINTDCLNNKEDRTLLYGYTTERDTWHVYIKDREIHTVWYGNGDLITPIKVNVTRNSDYIPNKRLYPDRCDYEFCKLLIDQGEYLSFTLYPSNTYLENTYYGYIL